MKRAGLFRQLADATDHEAMARILRQHPVAELKAVFAAASGGREGTSPGELLINIDGACRGNPGPMGAGVLVKDPSGAVVSRLSRHLGEGTNNRAEYGALLLALEEAARLGARTVRIRTDSSLLANQMNATFRIRDVTIGKLASRALELMRGFDSVEIAAVPREENSGADALATAAVRGTPAAPLTGQGKTG
jgi:ribonuclease HI